MSKFEEITSKAKEKVAEVAEQAKNYDYKGKVEEIRTKATDIADKAKEYDYKSKAEEIKEAVTSYDYKEKAKEVTEAVKGFDYEGKAKEVADIVKNYDYKAETENIKKGGLKYFWSKHKKLSIAAIIILVVGVVALSNSNDTDTANVKQNEVATNSQSGEKSDEKFIRDDDFILEYASKSDYRFKYKIVERDKYNRYLVSGEVSKDYAKYMSEEIVVIIYQIKDDYTVREFKETNPNKKQLKSIIEKMKSYEGIWNEEPFMTEITYGE